MYTFKVVNDTFKKCIANNNATSFKKYSQYFSQILFLESIACAFANNFSNTSAKINTLYLNYSSKVNGNFTIAII